MAMQYSSTYLYKLHHLTLTLDKVFNLVLQQHASIGLSQFLLLLAIAEHPNANQNHIANFLGMSRPAVNRQVDIAVCNGWISAVVDRANRRQHVLRLTLSGRQQMEQGIAALAKHAFTIFEDGNRQMGLMQHLDALTQSTKGVLRQQNQLKQQDSKEDFK